MQTRCIVKGEAQKNPLFWPFSVFLFSQDRLVSRNSTRKPLKLVFTNTPCKSTCLYNAPSLHTVDFQVFSLSKLVKMHPLNLGGALKGFRILCHLNLEGESASPN